MRPEPEVIMHAVGQPATSRRRVLGLLVLGSVVSGVADDGLAAGASPHGAASTADKGSASTEPARAAMAQLVKAMREQDLQALTTLLPTDATLAVTSTIDAQRRRSSFHSPASLRRDLEARRGFHELLFGFQGDDSLRDVFVLTDFQAWVAFGPGRFRPPGKAYADGRTFVRWRREGPHWVLAEIASPDA
jgi:hypothetical protein